MRLLEAINALISASEIVNDAISGKSVDPYKVQCFNREVDLLREGFKMGFSDVNELSLFEHSNALVRISSLSHEGRIKAKTMKEFV